MISKEIANRVVVLAVRQAAKQLTARRRRGGRREAVAGRRDGCCRKRREMTHPLDERLLLEGPGLNADASGVALAIGRFVDQQRPGRIVTIHERGERDPERLDVVGRGIRVGEMQPRRRRHAIVAVAAAALRSFEDRIERPRKRDRPCDGLLRRNVSRCRRAQSRDHDDNAPASQNL